jgi:hypothetical protein
MKPTSKAEEIDLFPFLKCDRVTEKSALVSVGHIRNDLVMPTIYRRIVARTFRGRLTPKNQSKPTTKIP